MKKLNFLQINNRYNNIQNFALNIIDKYKIKENLFLENNSLIFLNENNDYHNLHNNNIYFILKLFLLSSYYIINEKGHLNNNIRFNNIKYILDKQIKLLKMEQNPYIKYIYDIRNTINNVENIEGIKKIQSVLLKEINNYENKKISDKLNFKFKNILSQEYYKKDNTYKVIHKNMLKNYQKFSKNLSLTIKNSKPIKSINLIKNKDELKVSNKIIYNNLQKEHIIFSKDDKENLANLIFSISSLDIGSRVLNDIINKSNIVNKEKDYYTNKINEDRLSKEDTNNLVNLIEIGSISVKDIEIGFNKIEKNIAAKFSNISENQNNILQDKIVYINDIVLNFNKFISNKKMIEDFIENLSDKNVKILNDLIEKNFLFAKTKKILQIYTYDLKEKICLIFKANIDNEYEQFIKYINNNQDIKEKVILMCQNQLIEYIEDDFYIKYIKDYRKKVLSKDDKDIYISRKLLEIIIAFLNKKDYKKIIENLDKESYRKTIKNLDEESYRKLVENLDEENYRKVIQNLDEESYRKVIENLDKENYKKIIENLDKENYKKVIENLDEESYRKIIENLDEESYRKIIENLDKENYKKVIENLDEENYKKIIENLDEESYRKIIENLDEESYRKIIENLDKENYKKIIENLDKENYKKIIENLDIKNYIEVVENLNNENYIDIINSLKNNEKYYILDNQEENFDNGYYISNDYIKNILINKESLLKFIENSSLEVLYRFQKLISDNNILYKDTNYIEDNRMTLREKILYFINNSSKYDYEEYTNFIKNNEVNYNDFNLFKKELIIELNTIKAIVQTNNNKINVKSILGDKDKDFFNFLSNREQIINLTKVSSPNTIRFISNVINNNDLFKSIKTYIEEQNQLNIREKVLNYIRYGFNNEYEKFINYIFNNKNILDYIYKLYEQDIINSFKNKDNFYYKFIKSILETTIYSSMNYKEQQFYNNIINTKENIIKRQLSYLTDEILYKFIEDKNNLLIILKNIDDDSYIKLKDILIDKNIFKEIVPKDNFNQLISNKYINNINYRDIFTYLVNNGSSDDNKKFILALKEDKKLFKSIKYKIVNLLNKDSTSLIMSNDIKNDIINIKKTLFVDEILFNKNFINISKDIWDYNNFYSKLIEDIETNRINISMNEKLQLYHLILEEIKNQNIKVKDNIKNILQSNVLNGNIIEPNMSNNIKHELYNLINQKYNIDNILNSENEDIRNKILKENIFGRNMSKDEFINNVNILKNDIFNQKYNINIDEFLQNKDILINVIDNIDNETIKNIFYFISKKEDFNTQHYNLFSEKDTLIHIIKNEDKTYLNDIIKYISDNKLIRENIKQIIYKDYKDLNEDSQEIYKNIFKNKKYKKLKKFIYGQDNEIYNKFLNYLRNYNIQISQEAKNEIYNKVIETNNNIDIEISNNTKNEIYNKIINKLIINNINQQIDKNINLYNKAIETGEGISLYEDLLLVQTDANLFKDIMTFGINENFYNNLLKSNSNTNFINNKLYSEIILENINNSSYNDIILTMLDKDKYKKIMTDNISFELYNEVMTIGKNKKIYKNIIISNLKNTFNDIKINNFIYKIINKSYNIKRKINDIFEENVQSLYKDILKARIYNNIENTTNNLKLNIFNDKYENWIYDKFFKYFVTDKNNMKNLYKDVNNTIKIIFEEIIDNNNTSNSILDNNEIVNKNTYREKLNYILENVNDKELYKVVSFIENNKKIKHVMKEAIINILEFSDDRYSIINMLYDSINIYKKPQFEENTEYYSDILQNIIKHKNTKLYKIYDLKDDEQVENIIKIEQMSEVIYKYFNNNITNKNISNIVDDYMIEERGETNYLKKQIKNTKDNITNNTNEINKLKRAFELQDKNINSLVQKVEQIQNKNNNNTSLNMITNNIVQRMEHQLYLEQISRGIR